MTDLALARPLLESEIDALEPLGFVAVRPSTQHLHTLEVMRDANGAIEVRVPGRPPTAPELPGPVRKQLHDRGFSSSDPADPTQPWVRAAPDAADAVATLLTVLSEVFEEKPDTPLDLAHGSHRLEYETRQKLEKTRKRIEAVIAKLSDAAPEKDSDEDYILAVDGIHVFISPRPLAGGLVAVRVFAITNLGVPPTAELGLFIAGINFDLVFGRFTLDAEHGAIWADETLLGGQFSDEELRFAIGVVASLAREWTEPLKQKFGGTTYAEVLQKKQAERPPTKPGHGLYL